MKLSTDRKPVLRPVGKTRRNDADRFLLDLYSHGSGLLGDYPWELEVNRWAEMLACLWMEGLDIRPETARRAIGMLHELELLDIQALGNMDADTLDFLTRMLTRLQVAEETATAAILLAVNVAKEMIKGLDGHPQQLLRKHGESLAADLAKMFQESGVGGRDAMSAAVLFIQNACNLPVLVHDHAGVRALCSRLDISEAELVRRADALGLNLAVLDDLLAVQSGGSAGDSHPEIASSNLRKKKATVMKQSRSKSI